MELIPTGVPAIVGSCKYCGTAKIVEKAQSQEEADRTATESCECAGANMARRMRQAEYQINDLFSDVGEKERGVLHWATGVVMQGVVLGVSIKRNDRTQARITGMYDTKVQRTDKRKEEATV